jgi:hypothetical protein
MPARIANLNVRPASPFSAWARVSSLLLAAFFWTCAASAQRLTADEAETLVRASYFEGMPEADARRIGPAGASRLVRMLADADEYANHGQIMLALGLCGAPEAMSAIQGWVDSPREGEIDRALVLLETLMEAGPPSWTFRQHRGARLGRLTREAVVSSLADTGLPEAGRILDRLVRDVTDVQFERHLRDARSRHRERAAEAGSR